MRRRQIRRGSKRNEEEEGEEHVKNGKTICGWPSRQ
jgi:hypothetical protein